MTPVKREGAPPVAAEEQVIAQLTRAAELADGRGGGGGGAPEPGAPGGAPTRRGVLDDLITHK